MSASPLVFTFNNPKDAVLSNILEDASGSPLRGVSSVQLFTLQSPNIIVQNASLTGQVYTNAVLPKLGESSRLVVSNITIVASVGTNTIGSLTFVEQFQKPVTPDKSLIAGVSKLSTYVTSASGVFASYLFGNVIRVNDNKTGFRTVSIFSAE